MTPTPTPRLVLVVEAFASRTSGARFVRFALRHPEHGGDVYALDLEVDDARKVLDDLARAVEP